MRTGFTVSLIIAVICILASGSVARDDSVVTEVRIDDEGIYVGERQYQTSAIESSGVGVTVIGEDVVRFGNDIFVDQDEIIEGDVVALFGDIVCEGTIEGDAVAVGGNIDVGESGEIKGDAVSVLGMVTRESGGRVWGETVSVGRVCPVTARFRPYGGSFFSRTWRLVGKIVGTILIAVVGTLIIAVARGAVDNISMAAKRQAFKMGLIGLLSEVVILAVAALFAVTIIGIPISMLVGLAALVAFIAGYVGVCVAVGRRWGNHGERSPYASLMLGIILLQALIIIGGIVGLPGGVLGFVGYVVSLIGWAVIYVAATMGLGAVVMSRFGTRPVEVAHTDESVT